MKYLTTYIRLQGEEQTSLLLQHYVCRNVSVCFTCICTCTIENEKADRILTGRLLSWCRGFPWHKAVRRPKKWMEQAEQELAEAVRESMACLEHYKMESGREKVKWKVLLCMGEEVLILGNGQEAYLIGMSLGKGIARRITGNFKGILEQGAGILLTSEGAVISDDEEKLGEVLRLSGIDTEQQAGKHLTEYAKDSDGRFRTAVLVVTKGVENE